MDGMPQALPVSFETGRHYKVHRSYIWVAPIVAVLAVTLVSIMNGSQGLFHLFVAIRDGKLSVNVPLVIGLTILGFAVVIGLFIGLYALAWRNMSYVFDEREFSFYSGVITKKRAHIPYARVQSVNHRASLLQRLFGVCTVIIDSAGGASNKGVRVPYLRLETAERLRADLFARKAALAKGVAVAYVAKADTESAEGAEHARMVRQQVRAQAPVAPGLVTPDAQSGAAPGGIALNALDETMGVVGDWRGLYGGAAATAEEPVSYEVGLTNRELVLTGLSHDAPLVTAAIVGATLLITFAFAILAQDDVARIIAALALPLVLFLTIISWVFGLVGIAFSYGNFRVRRRGSRVEVERGLLARTFSGIDIERVQSIEVRQSVVRRLFGYCELSLGRIDAAGQQGSGNDNSRMGVKGLVIHPFVKVDRVDEILDALLPELADRPRKTDLKPLPRPALRRAILRRCVWFNWALWTVVAITACWIALMGSVSSNAIAFDDAALRGSYLTFLQASLAVLAVLLIALTTVFGVGAVLWARHSGYTWNDRFLVLRNDGLSTAQSTIPRAKIQSGNTRDNPFQRRLSLTSLEATTAAGTSHTTLRLVDVSASDGDAFRIWLEPRRSRPVGHTAAKSVETPS
ncbi:MAG: PH domain-containing protein [Eggerthellaceae bacterium]|nr:PH domain-containing protein [Eggerthellaceae bacterium]